METSWRSKEMKYQSTVGAKEARARLLEKDKVRNLFNCSFDLIGEIPIARLMSKSNPLILRYAI